MNSALKSTLTLDEVVAKIIDVLKAEFPMLRPPGIGLGPATALLSTGLLDSFAVVTLLASLEGIFAIDLDVEQIPFEQLETPATIGAVCYAALQKRGGAIARG